MDNCQENCEDYEGLNGRDGTPCIWNVKRKDEVLTYCICGPPYYLVCPFIFNDNPSEGTKPRPFAWDV
jgi:hypothetical protein